VHEFVVCGLLDIFVYGDLYLGNWRYGLGGFVLFDWGDSGVGYLMFDGLVFFECVLLVSWVDVLVVWIVRWCYYVLYVDVVRVMYLVELLVVLC